MKQLSGPILVLFLLFSGSSRAQELWGTSLGNYSGMNGAALNPASLSSSAFRWEFGLVTADATIQNNFLYMNKGKGVFGGESLQDEDLMATSDSSIQVFGVGSAAIRLPSFAFKSKKWAFGVHSAHRVSGSVRNLPYDLALFLKEGFVYDPLQAVLRGADDVQGSLMQWQETGLTVSRIIADANGHTLIAGVRANYNIGLNAYYMDIEEASYNSQADTLLEVYSLSMQYAHALGTNADDFIKPRGQGWGFNGGLQYIRNRNAEWFDPCVDRNGTKPYDFKLGVSLIDFGSIRFDQDAAVFGFESAQANWYRVDTGRVSGVEQFDSLMSTVFYGDPDAAQIDNQFTMSLPAALSLQFDLPLKKGFFVSTAVVQRLPVNENSIRRANQIAIVPRFETRMVEISLPYSWLDYNRHRLGFSMRVGPFFAGTDNIGPLLGLGPVYGANAYVGIVLRNPASCAKNKGSDAGPSKSLGNCQDK